MAFPVKKQERHDFYYSVSNPAISYTDFVQRCRNNEKKLSRELMEKIIMTPVVNQTSKIDCDWRECTICKKYKLWDMFQINHYMSAWYDSRCKDCYRVKRVVLTEPVVYTTVSSYVSPFRVRSRKWQMLSVKDIAMMEWIDNKQHINNIRQGLYLWRDIEKVIARYK